MRISEGFASEVWKPRIAGKFAMLFRDVGMHPPRQIDKRRLAFQHLGQRVMMRGNGDNGFGRLRLFIM
jgi:hypothetical protein